MRHLYQATPKDDAVIDQAKTYERRRCNHHTLEEPLTTLECFQSVIDPKESKTNKHRYIVASQDSNVRAHLRRIPGVPLVYINRSVMIMEHMANATEELRDKEEKGKLRAGLVGKRGTPGSTLKRKRNEDDVKENTDAPSTHTAEKTHTAIVTNAKGRDKKKKSIKPPNPLSVKKPKKRDVTADQAKSSSSKAKDKAEETQVLNSADSAPQTEQDAEDQAKRKRRRKHKVRGTQENAEHESVQNDSIQASTAET
jgi:U3 small nucleolar RNA-associated protein 23